MRGNHGAAAAAASAAAQKHGRQTAISMKRKKEKSLVYLQASRDGARKLIREDVEEVSERLLLSCFVKNAPRFARRRVSPTSTSSRTLTGRTL